MDILKVQGEHYITFKMVGNIDGAAAPALEAQLIPALDEAKFITIDFSEVKYVSSAGMRVLLVGEKKAKSKGGKMTIANVSPFVMEIFDVTGFANILSFS